MIADDEPLIRSMVAAMLEDVGYTVIAAADGREAVNVYRENKDEIDLVILDATMPNLSGRDAQIELQKINPGIKSILSSGYDLESAEGYQDIGVVAFVPKPYKREVLLKTVMEAMNAAGRGSRW